MDSLAQPVTLDVPQGEDLSRHFSSFRHDVNGCLALIVAATELIRYNPGVVKRMTVTLVEQPPKIAGKVREFVEQCERMLGLRPAAELSWYAALWKRSNLVAGAPSKPPTLTIDQAKELQTEITQLCKEMTQLGFMISGARSLTSRNGTGAAEALPSVMDQFTKTALKFDQLAAQFEKAANIEEPGARRIASGLPTQPVTLSPEQVALFHRRLTNFEHDMHEHLAPLLELSRIARQDPQQLQTRSAEFAQAPPKISGEMTTFATEFDKTFGIVRATRPA